MSTSKVLQAMLSAAKKMNQNGTSNEKGFDASGVDVATVDAAKRLSPTASAVTKDNTKDAPTKSVSATQAAQALSPAAKTATYSKPVTSAYYAPKQNSDIKTNIPNASGTMVARDLSKTYGAVQNVQSEQTSKNADKISAIDNIKEKSSENFVKSDGQKKYEADYQKLINPIDDGDSGESITGNVKSEPNKAGKVYTRSGINYLAPASTDKYKTSGTKYEISRNNDKTAKQEYNELTGKGHPHLEDAAEFAKVVVDNPIGLISMGVDYAATGVARSIANTIDAAIGYFSSAGGVSYPKLVDFQSGESPLKGAESTGSYTKDQINSYIRNASRTLDSINSGMAKYYTSGETLADAVDIDSAEIEKKYAKLNENEITRALNDLASSVGYMVPSQLANLIIPGSSTALLFTSGYADGYSSALKDGASASDASNYAILNGLNQSLGEHLVGGVVGKGAGAVDTLLKAAGVNLLGGIENATVHAAAKTVLSSMGEGAEEIGQGVIDTWAKQNTYDKNAKNDWGQLAYEGAMGAAMGGFYGALNFKNAIMDENHKRLVADEARKVLSDLGSAFKYSSTSTQASGIINGYQNIIDNVSKQKAEYSNYGEVDADTMKIYDDTIAIYSEALNEAIDTAPEILSKNIKSNVAEQSRIDFMQQLNEKVSKGDINGAISSAKNEIDSNSKVLEYISAKSNTRAAENNTDTAATAANGTQSKYDELARKINQSNTIYNSIIEKLKSGTYDVKSVEKAGETQKAVSDANIEQDINTVSGLLSRYTATMSNSVAADILNNIDLYNAFVEITGESPTGKTFSERRKSVKDIAYRYSASVIPIKAADDALLRGDKNGAIKILDDAVKAKKAENERIRNSDITTDEKKAQIDANTQEVERLSKTETDIRNETYTPNISSNAADISQETAGAQTESATNNYTGDPDNVDTGDESEPETRNEPNEENGSTNENKNASDVPQEAAETHSENGTDNSIGTQADANTVPQSNAETVEKPKTNNSNVTIDEAKKKLKEDLSKKLSAKEKSISDALEDGTLNSDNAEITSKRAGFTPYQQEFLVKSLIDGVNSDSEKIHVDVPDDGRFDVANNTPAVAMMLNKLKVKEPSILSAEDSKKYGDIISYFSKHDNCVMLNGKPSLFASNGYICNQHIGFKVNDAVIKKIEASGIIIGNNKNIDSNVLNITAKAKSENLKDEVTSALTVDDGNPKIKLIELKSQNMTKYFDKKLLDIILKSSGNRAIYLNETYAVTYDTNGEANSFILPLRPKDTVESIPRAPYVNQYFSDKKINSRIRPYDGKTDTDLDTENKADDKAEVKQEISASNDHESQANNEVAEPSDVKPDAEDSKPDAEKIETEKQAETPDKVSNAEDAKEPEKPAYKSNLDITEKLLTDNGYQLWEKSSMRRIYPDLSKYLDKTGKQAYNGVEIRDKPFRDVEYYISHGGRSYNIKVYFDCKLKKWVFDCDEYGGVMAAFKEAVNKLMNEITVEKSNKNEVPVEITANQSEADTKAADNKAASSEANQVKEETTEKQDKAEPKSDNAADEKIAASDDTGVIGGASKESFSISDYVYNHIRDNTKMTRAELTKFAEDVTGKTLASGELIVKDINDAMELGVNRYILDMDGNSREYSVTGMLDIQGRLPTQTSRSEEQENMQQFSTPPAIAFVADYAANVSSDDIVLEPSAGIGGLAVFAKKDGAKVYVNELSDKRMSVLKNLPFDGFYNENAEQINNILVGKLSPTVIIMNPPFSSSVTRNTKDTKIGAQHIEAALDLLADGGRLVAIAGRGMNDTAPAFKEWWKKIKGKYNVRANISLDGKNYSKYGTSFGIQMIVIDKNGPTTAPVLTATAEKVQELQSLLEGIRNDKERVHSGAEPVTARTESKTDNGIGENGNKSGVSVSGTSSIRNIADGHMGFNGKGLVDSGVHGSTDINESGTRNIHSIGSADEPGRVETVGEKLGVIDNGHGQHDNGVILQHKADAKSSLQVRGRDGLTADEAAPKKAARKELSDSMFDAYVPEQIIVNGAKPKPHPTKMSESAAMSAVKLPKLTYSVDLPAEIINNGVVSDIQVEQTAYAGQAHSHILPNGMRQAYFVGDGTGSGKGRIIAAIIYDNFRHGRKKAVWISENSGLFSDCKRDVKAVHGSDKSVTQYEGGKKADAVSNIKEGILFTTYGTIKQDYTEKNSNLSKLVEWFGKDYDGVIIFDESHNMANAKDVKGKRGVKKASKIALAGMELQNLLPNARFVYSSATGATEVSNLAYASRLGLWGEGTTFADSDDFISKIEKGGLSAMEVVARSMKSMGVYLSRNLSYDGVLYRNLEHNLTPEQTQQYNSCADAWSIIANNVAQAIDITKSDGQAKKNASSALWGAQQRFFNQVVTSMQVPSMIKDIEKQLANDKSIVIQLTNTNEAGTERSLAKIAAKDSELDLDDFDSSPRQLIQEFLEKSFPVNQYEKYTDDQGNEQSRPVLDSAGNPVQNREAVMKRDELIAKLSDLKIADSPLDMIISHFGSDMVAENTGRKKRVIFDRNGNRIVEKLSSNKDGDVAAFQDGKKRIIIFSAAGGTGKSYHADRNAKNQQQRIHYLLQAGWKADTAVQGLGRSHRSNEASAPELVLVTTNIPAQKRFIATIARRLDQLGALTKGQRDTGSQGIFKASDNLENSYAGSAVENTYRFMVQADRALFDTMAVKGVVDQYGNINNGSEKLHDIKTFLNHLFMLHLDNQMEVFLAFEDFMQTAVDSAKEQGKYDSGMENYKADRVHVEDLQEIENSNGAKTQYYRLTAYNKTRPRQFGDVETDKKNFIGFFTNTRSGSIFAVFNAGEATNARTGAIETKYRIITQLATKDSLVSRNAFTANQNIIQIKDLGEANKQWKSKVAELPKETETELHLIGGEILSIWDKLPESDVKINRVLLDDGNVIIGRIINQNSISEVLRRINITPTSQKIDGNAALGAIMANRNSSVLLTNGWKLKQRTVAGEKRIELVGIPMSDYSKIGERYGMFYERDTSYKFHYYIPNNENSASVLDRLFKSYSPDRIVKGDEESDVAYSKSAAAPGFIEYADSYGRNGTQNTENSSKSEAAPKSIGDMVDSIRKFYGIPISQGNYHSLGTDAIYKKKEQTIRTRLPNDLPSIAHELGHHLDAKYGISDIDGIEEAIADLPTNYKNIYSEAELPGEAVAEFMRNYLMNREATKNKFPTFYNSVYDVLPANDIKFVEGLSNDISYYMSAAPAEQYKSATVTSKQAAKSDMTLAEKTEAFYRNMYTKIVDSLDPIKNVVDYARNNLGALWVKGEKNPYVMATNALNIKSKAAYCITDALVDMNGNVIGESLMGCMKNLRAKELDDFSVYLMLRHSLEWVDAQDGSYKQVFANLALENPTIINQEIESLENKHPMFEETANRIYEYQRNLLQAYCVDGGAMTQEAFNALQKKYPCYVPFQRNIRGKSGTILPKTRSTFANQSSPVKRAKGSGYEIINVLESIANNTQRMISFAERNRVASLLADMSSEIDGFGHFMERVTPDVMKATVAVDAKKEKISKLAGQMGVSNVAEFNSSMDDIMGDYVSGYTPILKAGSDIVTVMRNGGKEYYQVHDAELYKAIASMTPKQVGMLRKISKAIMFPSKMLYTQFSLTFGITNPIRDFQTAWRMSDINNPIKYVPAYLKAFKQIITNSSEVKLYRAMGLGHSSKMSTDIDRMQTALRSMYSINESKAASIAKKIFCHVPTLVADINDVMETIPRLAEFDDVLKKTGDPHAAAYAANDVTTNFARGGEWGRAANDIFMFSNAAVQGVDKFIRNFGSDGSKESKAARNKRLAKIVITEMFITAIIMALAYRNDEGKEAYQNLSSYMKNNYYCVYVGDGKFIRVPKGRETVMLGSFLERCTDYTIGGDEEAFYEFGDYLASNLLPPFIPSDFSGDGFTEKTVSAIHSMTGSTALGGLFDIALNKNFLGNPIVSKSYEYVPTSEQYTPTTSWISLSIANAVGSSPLQIDYLIKNYTGYIGSLLTDATSIDESKRSLSIGFKDRFTTDSAYSTDVFNRVYENRDKASNAYEKDPSGDNALANEKAQLEANFISQGVKAINAYGTPDEQREQRMILQKIINNWNNKASDADKYIADNYTETSDAFIDKFIESKLEMTVNGIKMEYTLPFDEFINMNSAYHDQVEYTRLYFAQNNLDVSGLPDAYASIKKDLRNYYKSKYRDRFEPAS